MRRVVVTGAGTVNPLGVGLEATLDALRKGRGAIGPLDIPDLDRLTIRIGAQVRDWAPQGRADRFAELALAAGAEALVRAGLKPGGPWAARAGVVMGTAGGGHATREDSYRAVFQAGKARVPPMTVPHLMPNAAQGALSAAFGLQGPGFTVSTACASSNQALGLAFRMIRAGEAPVMLAGGADAMLTFGGVKAWEGLRVLSPDGCRPFDRDRSGMVQGEGAGVLVLEDRDHALARGAKPLAEVLGFAQTQDAGDLVQPSQAGAERCMALALADARLAPGDIGYINAHGTGTRANDRAEGQAIEAVFGPGGVAVSSTKGAHGHLMGAAGAVEALACLLALSEGILPPTLGLTGPDADCGALDHVAQAARQTPGIGACISNAFAFGGINAVLVLGQP